MRRVWIACGLLLLPLVGNCGDPFQVEIKLPKDRYIIGEPIEAEGIITNVSKSEVTLVYGRANGFQAGFAFKRADGDPLNCPKPRWMPELTHKYTKKTVPPGWSDTKREGFSTECETPGEFIITFGIYAEGPFQEQYVPGGPPPSNISGWSGNLMASQPVILLEPEGLDRHVFEALNRNPLGHREQLLKEYPTSTYAGWALLNTCPPLTRNRLGGLHDPDKALRAFCDRGGGEENTLRHLDLVQSKLKNYAEPLGQFLQAHPDFPHVQDLRRRYAMCLGLTGHMSEAMIQIEILAKGEGLKAEEARAFLAEKERESKPEEGSDKKK